MTDERALVHPAPARVALEPEPPELAPGPDAQAPEVLGLAPEAPGRAQERALAPAQVGRGLAVEARPVVVLAALAAVPGEPAAEGQAEVGVEAAEVAAAVGADRSSCCSK
jgi:hypothetical protein